MKMEAGAAAVYADADQELENVPSTEELRSDYTKQNRNRSRRPRPCVGGRRRAARAASHHVEALCPPPA
jgi:hypothetical protein